MPSSLEIRDTSRGRPSDPTDMEIKALSASDATSKNGTPPANATDIPVNAAWEASPGLPPSIRVATPAPPICQTSTASDPRVMPYIKVSPLTSRVSVASNWAGNAAPVTSETDENVPSSEISIWVSAAFSAPVRYSLPSTKFSVLTVPAWACPAMGRLSSRANPPSASIR